MTENPGCTPLFCVLNTVHAEHCQGQRPRPKTKTAPDFNPLPSFLCSSPTAMRTISTSVITAALGTLLVRRVSPGSDAAAEYHDTIPPAWPQPSATEASDATIYIFWRPNAEPGSCRIQRLSRAPNMTAAMN